MRKTYMMLLALVLTVVGATSAMGQKTYRAELDKSMFKAWTSNEPGAQEDANPAAEPKSNGEFGCVTDLYKKVDAYGTIFGSPSVYYLWYADITGTKKMTVAGTPGMKIRVMLNREPFVEGGPGDADGGAYVELIQEVGEDGKTVFDLSSYSYLHLNAIKVPGSGPGGVVKLIELEGSVMPVVGILSMINNGDAEGTDFASFPVSYDGPNNGGTANEKPEIVDGGVNGSKCFKVVSFPTPTETWHTQFYIKSDEVLPKGTKWKLTMSIKADHAAKITTSAQAQPRTWKGSMNIDEFQVNEEWKPFQWKGEIGVDDFQSIAFDLNNGDERNADDNGWLPGNPSCGFYFDNIEFGIDLGESNPMNDIACSFGSDVIRINLSDNTNIKDLVKNSADGKTLVYPNECATVTLNGKEVPLVSVEGRPDGNLYFFLLEDEAFEKDEVVVAFQNPEDAEHRVLFTSGKWEGEPMPDFSGLTCAYDDVLINGEIFSYLWGAPQLESADPEAGSFNLPANTKTFKVTFNQKVDAATVKAKLGGEALTVSPAEGMTKEVTLTYKLGDLDGVKHLVVSGAVGEKGSAQEEDIDIKYSFGKTEVSGSDQPQLIYASDFTTGSESEDAEGAGWTTRADNSNGMQPANSTAGNRLQHGQAGYAADVLYLAQRNADAGIALYGTEEDHKLTLQGGKTYHLSLKTAQWDAYADQPNRSLRVQVLTEDAVSAEDGSILDEDGILANEIQTTIGRVKENKDFTAFDVPFTPAEDGNFVIRLVAGDLNGNPGAYGDGNAIADVKVEYIPDVMGLVEMKNLAEALESAKATLEENSDERYDGAAFTALDKSIKEYEGKEMTAPSQYKNAVDELNANSKALKDHRILCDTYDPLPQEAQDVIDTYAETKFATTEIYKNLQAAVNKYATIEVETDVDPETGDEIIKTVANEKVLKDDAELQAAVDELQTVVGLGKEMFTVGKSNNSDAGIKVLVERLRLGVETLKTLGVDEDDELIVAVDNAMTDDDALAELLKNRVKKEIYEKILNDKTMFEPTVDENTGEEVAPSYDLSVFIKNPNIYVMQASKGYNDENVPGWVSPTESKPGIWVKWDPQRNIAGLPEDGAFTTWYGTTRMEQTITDLPAGVYTINLYGTDWGNQNGDDKEDPHEVDGFVYAKTSATPEVAEGEEEDRDVNFAATQTIFFAGTYSMDGQHQLDDITVTDGKLTIGIHYAGDSQYFFGQAEILLKAPATGYDYAKAYQEVLTGVEAAKSAAKVRAIEIYDLNGKRIPVAKKGVVIVKKIMSDGSVKVEKAIK